MFREEAATLKAGDGLEYQLYTEYVGNGVWRATSVYATFVKPSTSAYRVVIRPEYKDPTWNRARSVKIDKLTLIYRAIEAN